jgi:hypothetical protein
MYGCFPNNIQPTVSYFFDFFAFDDKSRHMVLALNPSLGLLDERCRIKFFLPFLSLEFGASWDGLFFHKGNLIFLIETCLYSSSNVLLFLCGRCGCCPGGGF